MSLTFCTNSPNSRFTRETTVVLGYSTPWILNLLGTQLLGFRFSGCLNSWISARAGQAPGGVQKSLRLLNAEPVMVLVVNRCCGFETADYTYGDTLVMEKLSEGGRGYLVAAWACLLEVHQGSGAVAGVIPT